MRKKIIISKPYIEECNNSDIFGKSIKLCSKITMENPNNKKLETKVCYYEFEKKFKKYLCDERSDAFVMGLLTTAMENNMDIEFKTPISEKLYYQLMTYYIPMVSKYNSKYPMYNIQLIGKVDNTIIKNEKAVATGCSGGVDSFYTILKHSLNYVPNDNKLTHIVYSSSGTGDFNEERIVNEYKKYMLNISDIAKDCNLNEIFCYNNLFKFYKVPFKGFTMFYTTTFGSIAYALQKLISIYYASSGAPISKFNLNLEKTHGHDSSVFDIFTTQCMNTENLSFYSTGTECSRIEKEQYIANYKPAQKNLIVCASSSYLDDKKRKYKNCSFCPKCLRTMTQFYALNKLKDFKDVFNVEEFYKHKAKYIGKMMGTNKYSYVKDMKKMAKENKIKIPFTSYFYMYLWYKPLTILKNIFRWSTWARKLYYKFNLDIKLNGYRDPLYEVYKDK